MTLLIFEPAKPRRSGTKKPLKIILGIGALVGTIALGSTFAASINLNDSGPVEFGQGVAQTVACSGDDSITVTPTSQFINSDGAGGYYFTSVSLSEIPTDCIGVGFTITAYDQAGETIRLTDCFDEGAGYKPVVRFDGSDSATTDQSYGEMFSEVTDADSSSFTLTWVGGGADNCTSTALAEDVYRISIESSSTEAAPAGYEVGDPGPGGGIIFYVSEDGFDCGPTFESRCEYLEVAPGDWNGVTGDAVGARWAIESLKSTNVIGITDEGTSRDGTGIGLGYKNSLAVLEQGNDATVAASMALSYASTSRDDWYLPTSVELNLLCQWNRGVPSSATTGCEGGSLNSEIYGAQSSNITDWYYWSSSEYGGGTAWLGGMRSSSNRAPGAKDATAWRVRPIRAF